VTDLRGYTEVGYGGVTVLAAANGGYYPAGNSFVVRGSGGTLLVDPSIALLGAGPAALNPDTVFLTHAHEDHMAGLAGFADVPVEIHEADRAAVASAAALVESYGVPAGEMAAFEAQLSRDFELVGRPDAHGVADGHVIDLGDRTATVVHLPGHTAGHAGLLVEPDGFLFVADIDLSSFGPYYGDPGSDLDRFDASMRLCGEIDARWYGTFHQKGVIDGAAEFRRRLRAYRDVLGDRESRMLAFLAEPRTLDEMAAHRFVYRPDVVAPYVDGVERRTAAQHVDRLRAAGAVVEVEPGRFRAG
jgi:glyoxylase-like metal-dependent hydrolase (beta-lactamase superfamily II)